jgi:hypothetical protein
MSAELSRKERVNKVHAFIKSRENNESYFNELYAKLKEEFNLEMAFNSDMRKNIYLNDLRQTIAKQADTYIKTKRKRPVKGAPVEFKEFVSHFLHDTMWSNR